MAKKSKNKPAFRKIQYWIPAIVASIFLFIGLIYGLTRPERPISVPFVLETTPTYSDEKQYGLIYKWTDSEEMVFTVYESARNDKRLEKSYVRLDDIEIKEFTYEKISGVGPKDRYLLRVHIHETYKAVDALVGNQKTYQSIGYRLRLQEKLPAGYYEADITTTGELIEAFDVAGKSTLLPTIQKEKEFDF